MAAFLNTQLDFIFFFYGLAFLLLGTVCFAIARVRQQGAWAVLGAFGFVHGAGEWLDLLALIIGDNPSFAIARTVLMTGSFVLLAESARLAAIQIGYKIPGRWIHVPLLALVALAGFLGGLNAANATARYALGLVGAIATSIVFALYARRYSGSERRWAISAAAGFAVYGIAAGAIVPGAPFWPASFLNHSAFMEATGLPIQFVRGCLACWMALSMWALWGKKLSMDVASARYSRYLEKQFVWTVIAMVTILAGGWVLTEYLGGIYAQNVREEARGDTDLIASHLAGETATVEAMVKALSRARSVRALLTEGRKTDDHRVEDVLTSNVESAGGGLGYILDRSGAVVASSDRNGAAFAGAQNFARAPYFQDSLAGGAGYHLAFDAARGECDVYTSQPVRNEAGQVVGVVVLRKSLAGFEADLRQFDRTYFLIDPNGIVVLTNRPAMRLRTLWPLPADVRAEVSRRFGPVSDRPLMSREIADDTWVSADGERGYVRRRPAGNSDWSLVILLTPRGIFASRVLGIIITLLTATLTLVYLVGRGRWVHDNIQLQKRLELEALTRDLDQRASTDPLTGLFNRLKFDNALAHEMARSQRYHTPLSLILYDIDFFKNINDTYGHQAGDKVLVELSRLVADRIRKCDVLARWGGEEFAILVPETTGFMALRMAENLRDSIRDSTFDRAGSITCSFGIAQLNGRDTEETLVARADGALYRAKINGRNRVELDVPLPIARAADKDKGKIISAA